MSNQQSLSRDRRPPVVEPYQQHQQYCSACGWTTSGRLVRVRAPHTEERHFRFCGSCIDAMAKCANDHGVRCP